MAVCRPVAATTTFLVGTPRAISRNAPSTTLDQSGRAAEGQAEGADILVPVGEDNLDLHVVASTVPDRRIGRCAAPSGVVGPGRSCRNVPVAVNAPLRSVSIAPLTSGDHLASMTTSGHNVTMREVRIAELKARLSEYLRAVRRCETIAVLDRETPVAQIVPVRDRTALRIRKPAPGTPPPNRVPLPKRLKSTIDVVQL